MAVGITLYMFQSFPFPRIFFGIKGLLELSFLARSRPCFRPKNKKHHPKLFLPFPKGGGIFNFLKRGGGQLGLGTYPLLFNVCFEQI